MGNDSSKTKRSDHSEKSTRSTLESPNKSSPINSITNQYFNVLAGSTDCITHSQLVKLYGEDLGVSLYKYLKNADGHTIDSKDISREEFAAKFTSLYGMSTDIYVRILQPVHHFIKVCSDSAGASAIEGDQEFLKVLVHSMTVGAVGDDAVSSILEWRRNKCEKFCNAVQSRVMEKVTEQKVVLRDYSSDILSPLQMWYLQCCLPSCYFPQKENMKESHWSPLYTSLQHGISTNRFETLVFDYRGATVTILRLKDGRIVVIAADQEWRHSGTRFGGPFTSYFEILPQIKRIDGASSIYCNLKLRTCAYGLSFKNEIQIDKDFNDVLDVEVWGCSGANTLSEQQKLKNWQKQQSEKHKKVPLPGNWDDNPDKTLLEMAGFQFSNERAAMDMEARQAASNKK